MFKMFSGSIQKSNKHQEFCTEKNRSEISFVIEYFTKIRPNKTQLASEVSYSKPSFCNQ